MARQTVQYIYEKIDSIRRGETPVPNQAQDYFDIHHWTPAECVLQKAGTLGIQDNFAQLLQQILDELRALSVCLDFPLACKQIEFSVPPTQPLSGPVLAATRRSIFRGLSFEVEERETAFQKVQIDYDYFRNSSRDLTVASRHYVNGLTLLGLEDSYSGLIDAAFMQFYQACEILCGNSYRQVNAQRHVATLGLADSSTTQIVLHHVWQVRHNYFGHGNTVNWLYAPTSSREVFSIAKQVLVVRWLCRTLLDCANPSALQLCREMRMYHGQSSDMYGGTIDELDTTFRVDYPNRLVKVKDHSGNVISEHIIK